MLQVVQVEELCLPQARLEPGSLLQLAFKGAQHPKSGAFRSTTTFSCVHASCSATSNTKSNRKAIEKIGKSI